MPLPDPHANELTVELDPNVVQLWKDAEENAKAWKNIAATYRAEIEASLGDAYAGTIGDRKVLTYRPSETWAVSRIRTDYPDLAQHYVRTKETEVFDIDLFRHAHPEIADRYQVRQFRLVPE